MTKFCEDWDKLVAQYSEQPAVLIEHELEPLTFCYGELNRLVMGCLHLFVQAGLEPGAVILSMLPNSVEAMVLFLAALYGGYGYAPIPCTATEREVHRWVSLLHPNLYVVKEGADCTFPAEYQKHPGYRAIPCDNAFIWLSPQENGVGGANSRLYLSTSGSTGDPKAIVIDGDTLWNSGRAFLEDCGVGHNPLRFWNYLPMSYLGGLYNLGLIPFCCGGSTLITEAFSGKSLLGFINTLKRFEITALWMVPTILRSLLQLEQRLPPGMFLKAMEPISFCPVGTAPLDLATKKKFEAVSGLSLRENYALSETTFLTVEKPGQIGKRVESSVGEPVSYAQFHIPTNSPLGVPFELKVKTPYLFLGYLTEEGVVELPVDESGYFPTGDMGYFDANGQLIVAGRLRDIIKKGGQMVALKEIEVLAQSCPRVQEAAALMIAHEYYGESYVLFVSGNNTDIEAVTRFLHENLVRYKWPETVILLKEIPKTASGKVSKKQLEDFWHEKQ